MSRVCLRVFSWVSKRVFSRVSHVFTHVFPTCFQLGQLSVEELQQRWGALDPEMEREIEDLRKRYQAKRQPILDAIDAKKKRQKNF